MLHSHQWHWVREGPTPSWSWQPWRNAVWPTQSVSWKLEIQKWTFTRAEMLECIVSLCWLERSPKRNLRLKSQTVSSIQLLICANSIDSIVLQCFTDLAWQIYPQIYCTTRLISQLPAWALVWEKCALCMNDWLPLQPPDISRHMPRHPRQCFWFAAECEALWGIWPKDSPSCRSPLNSEQMQPAAKVVVTVAIQTVCCTVSFKGKRTCRKCSGNAEVGPTRLHTSIVLCQSRALRAPRAPSWSELSLRIGLAIHLCDVPNSQVCQAFISRCRPTRCPGQEIQKPIEVTYRMTPWQVCDNI